MGPRFDLFLQPLEVFGEGRGVRIARLRVLPEAAADHGLDPGREVLADLGHRPGLVEDDRVHRVHRADSAEGELARDHLVEDDAQGENVRGLPEGRPAGLFGAHVGGRPDDGSDHRPRRGEARIQGRGPRLDLRPGDPGALLLADRARRQPEIQELGVAVGRDHDVVGLDVAVDDVRAVGVAQALGDLQGDLDRAQEVELLAGDQLADGLALDELHDDVGRPLGLPDVIDLGDGGMGHGRGRPGLLKEPSQPVGIRRQLGLDGLDRHGAVQALIDGPVDDAHPARADDGLDPVMGEGMPGFEGPFGRFHGGLVFRENTTFYLGRMGKSTPPGRPGPGSDQPATRFQSFRKFPPMIFRTSSSEYPRRFSPRVMFP